MNSWISVQLSWDSCIYMWTLHVGPECGRSTMDRGRDLEAGSRDLYHLERAPYDTACMSPTGRRGSKGHRGGKGAERSQGSMHHEVSMHESRPEQQRTKPFRNSVVPIVRYVYTSSYYCRKSFPVLRHDVMVVNSWISVQLSWDSCIYM